MQRTDSDKVDPRSGPLESLGNTSIPPTPSPALLVVPPPIAAAGHRYQLSLAPSLASFQPENPSEVRVDHPYIASNLSNPGLGFSGIPSSRDCSSMSDIEMESCVPSDLSLPLPTISSTWVSVIETRSLTLASGKVVTFTAKDVPEPAYIKVSKDIPLLASMWDDFSPAWLGVSVTVVCGHHIPLKFWPQLYRYWKPAAWKAKKAEWSKWKVSEFPFLLCFLSLRGGVCRLSHNDTFRELQPNLRLLLPLAASCSLTLPLRRPSLNHALPTIKH